jgi:hypothetical protein
MARNKITIDPYGALIHLRTGERVAIDAADVPLVEDTLWYRTRMIGAVYAYGRVGDKRVLLHRYLMAATKGEIIDHADRDGLNNRRSNLRIATRQQNGANQTVQKNNSVGLKGVHLDRKSGKWRATIHPNGQRINIGSFATAEEAHRAYCAVAAFYFGDFARAA